MNRVPRWPVFAAGMFLIASTLGACGGRVTPANTTSRHARGEIGAKQLIAEFAANGLPLRLIRNGVTGALLGPPHGELPYLALGPAQVSSRFNFEVFLFRHEIPPESARKLRLERVRMIYQLRFLVTRNVIVWYRVGSHDLAEIKAAIAEVSRA
jgi:hypothetical protein